MVIYADVLVSFNVLITYILLVAVRVSLKIPTNKWAVIFASVIGGFSSLVIFFDDINIIASVAFKLICACVIVSVAFLPRHIKTFLKIYVVFFLVSSLFGGAVYAIQVTLNPQNILYYNGIIYFDMSISYLVGCVLCVYGTFLLADYFITKHNSKGDKCEISVTYNDNIVTLSALVDTGNTLTDGMSGKPVIVIELSAVSPLFSREEFMFFKSNDYSNIPESMSKTIRLIPCKAVTGESLLLAFQPDLVKIKMGENSYITSFCTVAVTSAQLSQGTYRALINNSIFETVKEEKNNDKVYF